MLTEQELLKMISTACGRELLPQSELCESGILDSFALILLSEELEDRGILLSIARVPHEEFATPHRFWLWLQKERSEEVSK